MRLKSIFSQRSGRKNEPKPSAVGSTVSEYVQKSTIHGVAYVGDDERNKFERIWWFVMLVCSIFGACYLIYQAYRTMNENPIIESPALSKAPLWDAPFPAVTICHKALAVHVARWRRTFSEMDHAPMQKTITSAGACATFNMFDEKDLLRDGVILSTPDNLPDKKVQLWSRDSGFTRGLPLENYTYPFRAFTVFYSLVMRFGVMHILQFGQFESELLLIVHPPDEVPLKNRHAVSTFIKAESFNNIRLTPHLVVSEGIEKYEPNVRQCYYGHERHLKYYKTYTQNHCESECLADYTLEQCGCVPYFMPRFNDTKICGADSKCDLNAVDKLFLPEFNDDGTHALIDDCNCLQTCTQLTYTIKVVEIPEELAGYDGSALIIGNEHPFFTKNIRTELHSLSEFFSNCGGSLGLFLGVSILSIVELLYFCTARLYLHSKKRTADSTE